MSPFLSLKLGNEILNLSTFSIPYDNLVKLSKTGIKESYSKVFSTFILDIKSLENKTNKRKGEIFSILFDFEKFKSSFTKQELVLCIHSSSFESFERCVIRNEEQKLV